MPGSAPATAARARPTPTGSADQYAPGVSIATIAAIVAGVVAVAAIAYVWSRMMSEPGTMSDGSVGSVMDGGEEVRRIDLGTHTYVAQQAEEQLTADGVKCRTVSLEQGAFGIGLGSHHYLVYNAEDEARVRAVVDELLADLEMSFDDFVE